jgi:prephenate dehydratase
LGVIPIENSSGGAIYETVDILLEGKPKVYIDEEISLEVNLALLGRRNEQIKVLYSHFAPLEHCVAWLKKNLPRVERRPVASTAMAARRAFIENNAAALGSRKLAKLYSLDILHYPVEADIPNITSFLVVSGKKHVVKHQSLTTLSAITHNVPGGLCAFLETFRDHKVNLSRLLSRPIRGCPKEYAFLVDVEGGTSQAKVKRALKAARKTCVHLKVIGSYPATRSYRS